MDFFFHSKKCKHLYLGKIHLANHNTMISDKNTVIIKLLFKEHIAKKVALAIRNLGMIFKNLTYRELFLNLYKATSLSECHHGLVAYVQKLQ